MVTMTDVGRMRTLPPLPAFVTPQDLLADALPLLDPPSRISVTDAAERYVRVPLAGVWAQFDRDVAPYMTEPADMTQSRLYQCVCFVGPSQSAKTTMLATVAMHMVTCEPDPCLIVHMDQKSANAWVEEKLDPMILNSPEIRDRLGKGRDDSTFSRKRFRGMRMTIGIPVAQTLSSRTVRKVLLTDYDHMPQVLGPKDAPEGSPFGMARQRIRTYRSRGCVLVESSPAFPVVDDLWRNEPVAPHEFPPVSGGIVQIYNEGTRGRWYWRCPDCDVLVEPSFDRLHYDDKLSPAEAGEKAALECPGCGVLIAHHHKAELNRRAARGAGGWLHETGLLDEDGNPVLAQIGDRLVRRTDIASYALNGAAAAFASWPGLVSAYETARKRREQFDDDTELARVHYTDIGVPYSASRQSDDDLTAKVLRDHSIRNAPGIAPDWVRFVTVSVDVQGKYFAVMATGWGLDGSRTILERYDITRPPAEAPAPSQGDRSIEPGRYAEDWAALEPLATRNYPVEGAGWHLKPMALVVDFNGPPGASDNADRFWRGRRAAGEGGRWFLSSGRGGFRLSDRVWLATPERGSKGKKARSIKLLFVAVDRMKDTVLGALSRYEGGNGAYALPDWLSDDHLNELLAEVRKDDGYEKRPGVVRNETLDLSVQAQAVAEHKGLNRIDPERPPPWATIGADNPFASVVPGASDESEQKAKAPASRSGGYGIKWLRGE